MPLFRQIRAHSSGEVLRTRLGLPASALPALVVLLALVPVPCLSAQGAAPEISGHVILEGWAEAVPGATVMLLDEEYRELARVEAGPDGGFMLEPPGAGTY